jgi:hypothetical protein
LIKGGGTGFLGSHLVNAFKSRASQVLIVSRMPGVNSFSWVGQTHAHFTHSCFISKLELAWLAH